MIQPVKEKIILGIDPGTTIMGYGLLKVVGTKPQEMCIRDSLHSMPLYMIRDNAGIEGFMGINGTMLEMLFVHPRAIGTGIGRQLMRYALAVSYTHLIYYDCSKGGEKYGVGTDYPHGAGSTGV